MLAIINSQLQLSAQTISKKLCMSQWPDLVSLFAHLGAQNIEILLTGQFGEDFALRLQHVCDSALVLGSVSDDSDIHRIIPDPKRLELGIFLIFLCCFCFPSIVVEKLWTFSLL